MGEEWFVLWIHCLVKEHLIYNAFSGNTVLYSTKVWQLNKHQVSKQLATAMDVWRRSAKIARIILYKQNLGKLWIINRPSESLPNMLLKWTSTDKRERRIPNSTWIQEIQKAMSKRNLQVGDWNKRVSWGMKTGRRRRTLSNSIIKTQISSYVLLRYNIPKIWEFFLYVIF